MIGKNIIANYIGAIVLALAPIIAIPYYLDYLGSSAWGLISFTIMLQALFSLFDLGMSQVLTQEFIAAVNSNKKNELANTFFSFERIYWLYGLSIGFLICLSAFPITHYWLKFENSNTHESYIAIISAGIIFSLQMPSSIYRTLLNSIQKQVLLNNILIFNSILKNLGGVIVAIYFSSIILYFLWQIFSSIIDVLVKKYFSEINIYINRRAYYWDKKNLKSKIRPILIMSLSSMLAVLTMQLDKIYLSGMSTLEQLGYYSIASSLAMGCLQLIYPITNAILPHLTMLSKNQNELFKFNLKLFFILSLMITFAALFYYNFGFFVINFWLKSNAISIIIFDVLNILLIGIIFNILYNVGYLNWLVQNKFKKILIINSISLILCLMILPIAIRNYGTPGAALSWLTINVISFVISLDWLKLYFNSRKFY